MCVQVYLKANDNLFYLVTMATIFFPLHTVSYYFKFSMVTQYDLKKPCNRYVAGYSIFDRFRDE